MAAGKIFRVTTPSTNLKKVAKVVRQENKEFKRKVKRAIGAVRDKRYAVFDTISSYSDAGNIVSMFSINPGDSNYGERQGNKIHPTAMRLRYSWQAGDSNNLVRLFIFQWKDDDNSNPPTVLNDFVDISTQGTQNFPNTNYFYGGTHNFHLVYDSGVIALNDTSSNGCITRTANIYGKKLIDVEYSTGDKGWNNFYIVAMTDSAVAPHPQLRLQAQLEYDA